MKQYGQVNFFFGGKESAELQRTLIELLNSHGVISVSEAWIQKAYDEDKKVLHGATHQYVLHNKQEADIFRTVMSSEAMHDERINWRVTRRPNKNLARWMKEKEARENGGRKEV